MHVADTNSIKALRAVTGMSVVSAAGKRVGRVADVVFDPDGSPKVVGYVVERPRFLMLLDRRDRYLALDRTAIERDRIVAGAGRESWDKPAAARLGISWDSAVIWSGMPALTDSGEDLGRVRDALFDTGTGAVDAVGLTGGLTADIAVGVRDLPVRMVRRFDGEAVRFSDDAAQTSTSGGAAAAAGKGTAVAKQAASDAVQQAAKAAKTAAAYGASAARVAARSETGKKAASWLKALKDEVVDAMGDPDDE